MDEKTPPLSELQQHLQLLSAKFSERLKHELPELRGMAQALRNTQDPADRKQLLTRVREQLHKLSGSAGTFGFGTLGKQARELELQAVEWLEHLVKQEQGHSAFLDRLEEMTQQNFVMELNAASGQTVTAVSQAALNQRHIYILEHEVELGENLRQTLNNFGYIASHFASVEALDEAIREHMPDALIIESQGLEYAAKLQAQRNDALSLLVVAPQDDFSTQLQAVRAGAMGFFCKPLNFSQLENRLERCFAQQQGDPYRVLIVDDDLELATRYSLVLRGANMQVEIINDPAMIFAHMRDFNPEVVLLDVNMPTCKGPELAQIIRFNDDWLRIPIIYLSAETDIVRQMSALLKAGDDFVTKPISDNALIATVFARAQRARLLSNALSRDSLTGLLKHADIKDQLAVELERTQRKSSIASVVMLDIDHFKQVNDNHGHSAGDNVIRSLANLLRQRLRRVDCLGRYGGEEFLAVLPDCDAEQALRVLDEIRQRFSELCFLSKDGQFSVTLSAGIAMTRSADTAGELLERADRALYAAKHNGRNQVQLGG
ncbi:diguanylate cyclase [Pseudomonas marincola]|uniref:diguanylate cyclase n=1 Tax=Pseudomonas marincola TaxID=437900 RepID=UPI0008E2BBED|nr:diguanylate cyclase [Pseudomonas marincola]SFU11265.1 diguanylate cyclase (GGDEF) domain-containing protein [Pseudomonas marincola]